MNEAEELSRAYGMYRKNGLYRQALQCAEGVWNLDRAGGLFLMRDFRELMVYEIQSGGDASACWDLSRESYMCTATDRFDDFMVAMEWERNPKSRFWLPRRRILEEKFGICTAIEKFINEDGGKKLTLSTPPGCGKSTLIKFLMAYIMGKYPQSKNMYVSYADGMVKMMMDAVSDMLTSDEYCFQEIFPLGKPDKSMEYNTIGYRRKGDAQTFNLCSIGGSITGRTRADKFMITDDLVKNAEEARSPERLETLYANYTDTISTRQIGNNVKEIMLGTIWSIYDPISREKIRYEGERGYHFYAFPVCDDEGHSNFHYDCEDCYTDEKIAQLREKLDPVTFSCLYLQRGVQKEGMPFTQDQLTWYDGILPDGEPDNIFAFCDVAFGGGDSLSMPIAYQYGSDIFIHDVVFNRRDKSVTIPIVARRLAKNNVRKVRFEANVGGSSYADEVSTELKAVPYVCNVTSKRAPNTMSKLSKIEQYQQNIREIYFRRDKDRGREYDMFINELEVFSFTQKNLHDDAADSLAGICDMLHGSAAHVVTAKRIW